MTLRGMIHDCNLCPLHENMTVSPVAPELIGNNPKFIMILGGNTNSTHDKDQSPISDSERYAITKILKEKNISGCAVTRLVKCAPCGKFYRVPEIKQCAKWLTLESSGLFKIGCGGNIKKYFMCDAYLPAISKIFESTKNIEIFKKTIDSIK